MSEWRYRDALREALAIEMREDDTVFLAGTDIAGGGVMAVTKGLMEEFGRDRVRDAPIGEMALLAMAVGAAMAGYRPIVELMFMDFIGVAFHPLLNQAAKLRYMTAGAVEMPLVVRTQTGIGRSGGAQHSQSLEAVLAHIPGLHVVMPSNADDAACLLRGAIRSTHPVVMVENRHLYGRRFERPATFPKPELPGRAAVRRRGTDVTIVAWGRVVLDCLDVADRLQGEGIDAEVIDLRSIAPLDVETILTSVAVTHRLLVVSESVLTFGASAEVVRVVATEAWDALSAAPVTLGGLATPIPYSPALEAAWGPTPEGIEAAVRNLTRAIEVVHG